MEASHSAPEIGSLWRHYNGQVYQVVRITNLQSKKPEYPETVVYFNVLQDTWWSRPVSEWHRSFSRVDNNTERG
jgi:hypothetical protein